MLFHRDDEGADFRALEQDVRIEINDRKTGFFCQFHGFFHDEGGIHPGRLLFLGREMMADVLSPDGAEDGVGESVVIAVAVAMGDGREGGRYLRSGQDEAPAFLETVDVFAIADPK